MHVVSLVTALTNFVYTDIILCECSVELRYAFVHPSSTQCGCIVVCIVDDVVEIFLTSRIPDTAIVEVEVVYSRLHSSAYSGPGG